jgi:hypothetical protein
MGKKVYIKGDPAAFEAIRAAVVTGVNWHGLPYR